MSKQLMSYTPVFTHPITADLTVTNELLVETTATIEELHVTSLFADNAEISTIEAIDVNTTNLTASGTVSAMTGSFSSGLAAPQGDFANISVSDRVTAGSAISWSPLYPTTVLAGGDFNGSFSALSAQNTSAGSLASSNIYLSYGSTESDNYSVLGINNESYNSGSDYVSEAAKTLYLGNSNGDISIMANFLDNSLTGGIHLSYDNGLSAFSIKNAGEISLGTTFDIATQEYQYNIGSSGTFLMSQDVGHPAVWKSLDEIVIGSLTVDVLNAGQVNSNTGNFTSIETSDLTASGTITSDFVIASTGSFTSGIEALNIEATSATIDTIDAQTGTFVDVTATNGYITNLYTDNIIPTPVPGASSPFNGWFLITSKSLVSQGITSLTGPSGYEPVAGDASSLQAKYVHFDAITQYPQVVVKSYPTLYGEVFEALYRQTIYDVATCSVDMLLWAGAPETPTFNQVDAVDFLNSLLEGVPPSNYTVQSGSTDFIVANIDYLSTASSENSAIAKLLRTTQPTLVPYDATAVRMKQISDPEALWDFYNTYVVQNQGLYNPNGSTVAEKDSYFNNVGHQRAVNAKYRAGVTYQYNNVSHIVCSTTAQTDPANAVCAPSGLTRIHLGSKHYITEGSTVIISGFSGAWAVLNGTYVNEIPFSFMYDPINNTNGHVDQASLAYYANGFCLRFDSSALPQESTGPTKGYAIYTGNPRIRVTHQLTPDISYHSWVGALLAYHREAFGTTEHASCGYLIKDDGSGVPLDDWEDTAYLPAFTSKLQYFNNWLGVLSLYSNTTDMSELWLPADHYDMRAKFITAVPDYDVGINVCENYVTSLNQLWYSFSGALTTVTDDNSGLVNQLQIDTCDTYGISNASTVAFTHTARGAAAPSINHYPFGASPLDDPRIALNFFNFGVIKSALSGAKTIGYLNISSSLPYLSSAASLMWERQCFFPAGTTYADSLTWPNKWVGLWAQPLAYIMQWFVSEGCTDLICDNSVNYGGYAEWIAQHFGENRFATNKTSIFENVENQLAAREEITGLQTHSAIAPEQPLLECSFINTEWGAGSVWNLGQLAWIQSEASFSAGNVARFLLLGDDQDDVISATMTLKVLGSSKGYYGGAFNMLSYVPNNVLANIPDTYLYSGISGELDAQNEYNITTAGDYTPLNHISNTTAVSANSAGIKGAGDSWIVGVESLVYPDFGFTTNPRTIITGWAGPQNPDVDDFTTWRHAYLEASITEILLTW